MIKKDKIWANLYASAAENRSNLWLHTIIYGKVKVQQHHSKHTLKFNTPTVSPSGFIACAKVCVCVCMYSYWVHVYVFLLILFCVCVFMPVPSHVCPTRNQPRHLDWSLTRDSRNLLSILLHWILTIPLTRSPGGVDIYCPQLFMTVNTKRPNAVKLSGVDKGINFEA